MAKTALIIKAKAKPKFSSRLVRRFSLGHTRPSPGERVVVRSARGLVRGFGMLGRTAYRALVARAQSTGDLRCVTGEPLLPPPELTRSGRLALSGTLPEREVSILVIR